MALFWAEHYLDKMAPSGNRLLLVISDGLPYYYIEKSHVTYEPPVSSMDTLNASRKIMRRGTDIVDVALDDAEFLCYQDLKQIYPSAIACTELNRLTGQVLGVITKKMMMW